MKTLIGVIVIIILAGGAWLMLGNKETSTPTPTPETETPSAERGMRPTPGSYAVSPEESLITWTAGKPLIAGYVHTGTLAVKSGAVTVEDAAAAGSFEIDIASVKVTSLGGGKAGKESQLEGHLKSDDFFGVEKFPTASFTIKSITPAEGENAYTVTGALSMKGKTNDVTFPANIYMEDGKLHAHADLTIDRTLWGVNFGSASIFNDLANNAIGNDVTLSLKLIATPQ